MVQSHVNAGGVDCAQLAPACPADRPIPATWLQTAHAKGIDVLRRVRDKYHIELGCRTCETPFVCKAYVLMHNRPNCPTCQMSRWHWEAERAGARLLRRDDHHRHFAHYRLRCGHEVRRQIAQVRRSAHGHTAIGCEHCQVQREAAAAKARGWQLIGADPVHGSNYRRYRHSCGHQQSIAVANMVTGRVGCSGCGDSWMSQKSFIYLFDLRDPGGQPFVKLGYSKDPLSRLHHQLELAEGAHGEVLRSVAIKTGHAAVRLEKAMHAKLRRGFPAAVVPAGALGWIKVTSEIYHSGLAPHIHNLLDDLETKQHG